MTEDEIARIDAPIGLDIGAALAGRDRHRHPRRVDRAPAPAGDPPGAPAPASARRREVRPRPDRRGRGRDPRALRGPAGGPAEEGPAALGARHRRAGRGGDRHRHRRPPRARRHARGRGRRPHRRRARRPTAAAAHVSVAAPFTGRANLFAEAAGVLRVDADAGARAQRHRRGDHAGDPAGLRPRRRAGRCSAPSRSSPTRVAGAAVEQAEALLRGPARPLRPPAWRSARPHLILTRTPGMKDGRPRQGRRGGDARGSRRLGIERGGRDGGAARDRRRSPRPSPRAAPT